MELSHKVIRNAVSVLLVALMTGCAELTGNREYIFPEIGALCIGLWVVDKHVWLVRKWQIPVLFTLAVIAGICIVRYMSLPLPLQMETGFFLVAMMLMLTGTSITPAISACLLPALIGTDSWLYPIVVLVATIILTTGQYMMEKMGIRKFQDENLSFSVPPSKKSIFVRWIVLMLILLPILVVGDKTGAKFVVVPPLVVTLVEFSNSASGFRKRPYSTWLLLVVAAIIGAFTECVVHQMWNVPQTLSAIIATTAILQIFHHTGKYFAPAAAIALVPMILPDTARPLFPLYVAIGSAYFIFMAGKIRDKSKE